MATPSKRSTPQSPPPSLREAHRNFTQTRIIEALAALIEEEHPFDVSMAEVAKRAGVSEPTLYRHFPTKRDLFGALASMQYRRVTEGLNPRSIADLADAVRTVYLRAEQMEPVVRWTLAAPDPERVPRPNKAARLAMLRGALAEATADLPTSESELLLRVVLLLTSPMAWLYWRDYLELESSAAADTAAWAIERMARR